MAWIYTRRSILPQILWLLKNIRWMAGQLTLLSQSDASHNKLLSSFSAYESRSHTLNIVCILPCSYRCPFLKKSVLHSVYYSLFHVFTMLQWITVEMFHSSIVTPSHKLSKILLCSCQKFSLNWKHDRKHQLSWIILHLNRILILMVIKIKMLKNICYSTDIDMGLLWIT